MLAKPSFYSTILTTAISCVAEGISDTKCDVKDTGELKTRVAPDYTDMHLIDEGILRKCIVSLVDKYTIKSKQHKVSLTQFMKTLMDV